MRTPDKDRAPRGEGTGQGEQRGQKSKPPDQSLGAAQQSEEAVCRALCVRIAGSLDALVIQIQRIADHFDPPSGPLMQEINDRGMGKKEAGVLQAEERYFKIEEAEAYLGAS